MPAPEGFTENLANVTEAVTCFSKLGGNANDT